MSSNFRVSTTLEGIFYRQTDTIQIPESFEIDLEDATCWTFTNSNLSQLVVKAHYVGKKKIKDFSYNNSKTVSIPNNINKYFRIYPTISILSCTFSSALGTIGALCLYGYFKDIDNNSSYLQAGVIFTPIFLISAISLFLGRRSYSKGKKILEVLKNTTTSDLLREAQSSLELRLKESS